VDEEKGIAWGIYCSNHRGLASVEIPDGSIPPIYFQSPNSMPFPKFSGPRKAQFGAYGDLEPQCPAASGTVGSAPYLNRIFFVVKKRKKNGD
jgi:hypothetical protein